MMTAATIADYFREVDGLLHSCPLTVSVAIQSELADMDIGYFKARMIFVNGSELHLFELVTIKNGKPYVEKCRYHYQSAKGTLVRRWDNAKHHPELKTFPDHVHVANNAAKESKKPAIPGIFLEIIKLIEDEL